MAIHARSDDTRLNRGVAIKCLKPESGGRFQVEARAIAALGHPHICRIFDVGADHLVLEFVDGSPLQGPLSAEEALPLALQIAGALEAAHKRGILHRDLKPANVLVIQGQPVGDNDRAKRRRWLLRLDSNQQPSG